MASHPLTNFEIQKYYQNESKFNGIYSGNNLSKIKDGAFIVNLDEYESVGTHWIAFYINDILIILELKIFQIRLKNLLEIKVL